MVEYSTLYPLLALYRQRTHDSYPLAVPGLGSILEPITEAHAQKVLENVMSKEPPVPFGTINKILTSAAPFLAVGAPMLASSPEKSRTLLDTMSVVSTVSAVGNLMTKAVKATSVYKSLPDNVKDAYLQKVVPAMTEHVIHNMMPVLMLQAAKMVLVPKTPKAEEQVHEFIR